MHHDNRPEKIFPAHFSCFMKNILYLRRTKEAAIAQLVERFTRNEEVPSSSLGCGSQKNP